MYLIVFVWYVHIHIGTITISGWGDHQTRGHIVYICRYVCVLIPGDQANASCSADTPAFSRFSDNIWKLLLVVESTAFLDAWTYQEISEGKFQLCIWNMLKLCEDCCLICLNSVLAVTAPYSEDSTVSCFGAPATRSSTALSRISRMLVASTTTNLSMHFRVCVSNVPLHVAEAHFTPPPIILSRNKPGYTQTNQIHSDFIQTCQHRLSLSVPVWWRKADKVFLASAEGAPLRWSSVNPLDIWGRDLFTHGPTLRATACSQKCICLAKINKAEHGECQGRTWWMSFKWFVVVY